MLYPTLQDANENVHALFGGRVLLFCNFRNGVMAAVEYEGSVSAGW